MSLLHSCCSLLSWHGEQLKSDVIWLASSMQFAQLHIEYTTYARIPNTRFASPNENTLESNEADENPKSFLPIKHHWVFIQSISCMRFFFVFASSLDFIPFSIWCEQSHIKLEDVRFILIAHSHFYDNQKYARSFVRWHKQGPADAVGWYRRSFVLAAAAVSVPL